MNASTAADHYRCLGLCQDATVREIKEAYVQLALLYHPDKKPANEPDGVKKRAQEKFCKVTEAYEVLANPSLRAAYDTGYDNIRRQWDIYERTRDEEHRREQDEQRLQEAKEHYQWQKPKAENVSAPEEMKPRWNAEKQPEEATEQTWFRQHKAALERLLEQHEERCAVGKTELAAIRAKVEQDQTTFDQLAQRLAQVLEGLRELQGVV